MGPPQWRARSRGHIGAGGHYVQLHRAGCGPPEGIPGPSCGSGRRDTPGASVIETLHGRPSETEALVPGCGFKN